jgi:hypothetical protein
MLLRRLAHYFAPTPAALTLAWAAFFELAASGLLFTVYGINTGEFKNGILLMSMSGLPLAGLLLTFAAAWQRRYGPRALLWMGALVFSVASLVGFGFAINYLVPESRTTMLGLAVCCSPAILVQVGLAGWSGFKTWPELSAILRAARYQRLVEMIDVRGETSLAEIGQEVSLQPGQVLTLLNELIASGELMASVDATDGRVYSAAALAEKQRLLVSVLQARGKVLLADLASELRSSTALVHTWVYHLAQRHQLQGALDAERGLLISADAEYLAQDGGRCPHCGGQLDVAGKGVIQCRHCGVEVFL